MQACKTLALHVKVKSKAVRLQVTKGYMRSTGVSLLILNLDSRLCEWSASRSGRFASRGRASGTYTRFVGPQSLAGRLLKKREKSLSLVSNRTSDHAARSLYHGCTNFS
jgi:hypothetical protein